MSITAIRRKAIEAGLAYFDRFGRSCSTGKNARVRISLTNVRKMSGGIRNEIAISGDNNFFKKTITKGILQEMYYTLNKAGFGGDITVDIDW